MPVTIKSANVKYKNSQGEYVGVNSVSDNTTADQITAIQNAGAGQVTAVQNKGAEVLASIPDPYEDLANEVDDLSSALNDLDDVQNFNFFDVVHENQYNVSDTVYGYFPNANNDDSNDNTSYMHTNTIIPVISGKPYFTRNIRKIKTYLNGVFVETLDGNGNSYKAIIFSNINGVRFDFTTSNKNSIEFYIYQGEEYASPDFDKLIPFYKNQSVLIESIRRAPDVGFLNYDVLSGLTFFSWNVVDNSKIVINTSLDSSGNITPADQTSSIISATCDFSPVTPGETIYYSGTVYCYDANKDFIKTLASSSSGILVLSNDVYYIRAIRTIYRTQYEEDKTRIYFNMFRRGYGKYNLGWASTSPQFSSFPMFIRDDDLEGFKNYTKINPYADLKFATIGDSFTAPGVWGTAMCNILSSRYIANKAVSGGSFAQYTGYVKTAYQQAQELVSDNVEADYICVFLGVNDKSNQAPIGNIVESVNISDFNQSTFIGGVQACVNYLQNNYPNATILLGYTPAGNNYNSGDYSEYIAALKAVAEKYNVQYVDTLSCGVTKMSSVYSDCFESGTSGGHPTTKGATKIGEGLAKKILHSCC